MIRKFLFKIHDLLLVGTLELTRPRGTVGRKQYRAQEFRVNLAQNENGVNRWR
jgi:hypothetical protein